MITPEDFIADRVLNGTKFPISLMSMASSLAHSEKTRSTMTSTSFLVVYLSNSGTSNV